MTKVIAILVVVGIGAILALTNPSMNDYQDYIRQEIIKESQKNAEGSVGQALVPFLGGFAGNLAALHTIRDDYLIFSTYELAFGKQRLRLLGIGKRFIVLESPKGMRSPGSAGNGPVR